MTALIRAIQFQDRAKFRKRAMPGSFWIGPCEEGEQAAFWFFCPSGSGQLCRITVGHRHKPAIGAPSWNWNGSRSEPTLTPSIRQGCSGWHGWLRDGYWEVT